MEPRHILVADEISDAGLERLRAERQLRFTVRHGLTPSQLAETIGEYDGVLIRSAVKITREVLAHPGRLEVVARAGVGVDNVDLGAATEAGVLVLNTPDANTLSTAEHTIAMMLALHRRIPDAHGHVMAGQWKRSAFSGDQVAGRTLGIVGLGRIGRAVAQRALALEMKVIAHDPFVAGQTALDGSVAMFADLNQLLGACDCLTLHASLSEGTRNLLGAEQIARMKRGAKIVNCARGALIDETALADALNKGHLSGAALDVFDHEPPTGSPILTAKNVVLTPHLAASTGEAQQRVSVDAVDAIVAYLLHGEIRSAVNAAGLPAHLGARHRAFLDLAHRMGLILAGWCSGGVEQLRVTTFGDSLHELAGVLPWHVLVSVLGPHLDTRINLVNAREQARRRGIHVEHTSQTGGVHWPDTVAIDVCSRGREHRIEGTVFADGRPRLLSLDGYRMEIVPEGAMALIFNDDRPGVIGLVGNAFGGAKINIADMTLSRQGDAALMVLKLDGPLPDELLEELRRISPPIRAVRSVQLAPSAVASV